MSTITKKYGETYIATATPNTGYRFVKWQGTGVDTTDNPATLTCYGNNTLEAVFDSIPYDRMINYTATADLKTYSYQSYNWCLNNVDQNASTWDSTTGEGVLVLNSGVNKIGGQAFHNCTALLSIDLPNAITAVQSLAFASCTNLTSVTFGNSLTEILGQAFNGTSIASFTIPSTVTTLYKNAFKNTVWWNNQQDEILYKDGWCLGHKETKPTGAITITSDKIAANAFENCSGITSVVFSSTLTRIGYGAFQACSKILKVDFPESLVDIGAMCFYNCTKLKTVACRATTPPTLGLSNFNTSSDTLFVPAASLSAYQADSAWSSAFTYINHIMNS